MRGNGNMQFYILHEDPITSAKMLPDYALKRVNIREGWQMLSDIGHILDIVWVGQNQLYSKSHAKTLSFCSSLERFRFFLNHYSACLTEYLRRYGNNTVWHERYNRFMQDCIYNSICLRLPKDEYEQTLRYLLNQKRKHLTESEIEDMEK